MDHVAYVLSVVFGKLPLTAVSLSVRTLRCGIEDGQPRSWPLQTYNGMIWQTDYNSLGPAIIQATFKGGFCIV